MNAPKLPQWRAKHQTVYGCAVCGWSAAMGIHLPALTGPSKGQPWGHAYVAPRAAAIRSQPDPVAQT